MDLALAKFVSPFHEEGAVDEFVLATVPTCDELSEEPFEVDDDLKRETCFYAQALKGVENARGLLDEAEIPHRRPHDYYASMIKTDAHMTRVKERLLFESQKMEAFEKRKSRQNQKLVSKEMKAEKLKQKAARKKKSTKDAKREYTERNRNNVDGVASSVQAAKKQKKIVKKRPGKSKRGKR